MTTINRKMHREGCITIFSNGRRRPVIIILEPPGHLIGLRLKGERHTYYLPIDWAYKEAVLAHVRAERRKKLDAKKGA